MAKTEFNVKLSSARGALSTQAPRELLAHTIISSLAEGIIVYDQNLRYTMWNPFMEALTGLSANTVLNKSALDLVFHFEQEGIDHILRRALAGEQVTTPDTHYGVPATGKSGWKASTYTPHRDESGKVVGVICVVNDISKRKRNELLELDRVTILEMVACNAPLTETLCELAKAIEGQYPDAWCSVSLLKNGLLTYLAAPQLPPRFAAATDRQAPDPDLALALENGIFTYRDSNLLKADSAAAKAGIVAVWSVPVPDSSGSAGLINLWFKHPLAPTFSDQALLTTLARLAAVAVEQRNLLERLSHQANHDTLTGLPNRTSFEQALERAVERAEQGVTPLAVLFIDLDRFKIVNDTLGHRVGDTLLQETAGRLQSCIRQSDHLARMGGDEFALILESLRSPHDARRVAQTLLDTLLEPFCVEGHELFMTASVGVSIYPDDGADVSTLLSNVDSAMYQAKAQGKNRIYSFLPKLNADAVKRLELETQLRRAVERRELRLHYQPKVALEGGQTVGFEALLRWQHSERGLVPPGDFIPIAEESGLIVEMGNWVLKEACRQAKAWQMRGHPAMPVAVNVSAWQFARTDFVETVMEALKTTGLEPELLELELTESVVMHDVDIVAARLQALREVGVRVSIDDFGTGYSSMAYLRRLPIDALKIDRAFINDMTTEQNDGSSALVQAIVTLAHSLGLKVVAEGIEEETQRDQLRAFGCDTAQGFLFSRPLPAEEVWKN